MNYAYITSREFLSNLDKSKPSIFFDVDHTLIFPINKKKMYSEKDGYAWVPHKNAKTMLQNAVTKFTVYFVTNQLKYDPTVENRLKEMVDHFNIDVLVLIATERNVYRKPGIRFLNDPNIPGGIPTIDPTLSFHCGDAAGRKTDFSDDDLWFANHGRIKFYTPEEVFDPKFDINAKRFFTPIPLPGIDHDFVGALKSFIHCNGIMLVGLPGSGKTYIRNWYIDNFSKFKKIIYVNNDSGIKKFGKYDPDNTFLIVDNTNLTDAHRSVFADLKLKIVHIDITAKDSIRGVAYRTIMEGGAHIPDIAIYGMNKKQNAPYADLYWHRRPVLDHNFPPYLVD